MPELSPYETNFDPAVMERFFMNVDKQPGGCWLWTAGTSQKYGYFFHPGSPPYRGYAHRFSYQYHKGAITDGKQIDHLCRNKLCVNPDHLEVVTIRENVLRGLRGVLRTHCSQGHERTTENTYIYQRKNSKYPTRQCKICHMESDKRRRARAKAAKAKEKEDRNGRYF